MGFDIVRGFIAKPQQTQVLVDAISRYFDNSEDDGTLYLGYPLTASSDNKVTIDALLLSKAHGLVAFTFENHGASIDQLKDEQDALYYHLDFYLKKYHSLRQGRKTIVTPIVITIVIDNEKTEMSSAEYHFSTAEKISETMSTLDIFPQEYYKVLCEALQKVTNIRPQKSEAT